MTMDLLERRQPRPEVIKERSQMDKCSAIIPLSKSPTRKEETNYLRFWSNKWNNCLIFRKREKKKKNCPSAISATASWLFQSFLNPLKYGSSPSPQQISRHSRLNPQNLKPRTIQAIAGQKYREIKKAKGEGDVKKKMEKASFHFPLLLSFFLVFLSFPHLSSSVTTIPISLDEPSAYKELNSWGFPVGLLPANVKDYSLNRTTGVFSVSLGDQCQITLPPDNYVATYKRTVTGRLMEGKIGQLDGIQVWALFKWWSITGIRTSGENLVFEVGVVSAKFPSKSFDESPLCEGTTSASR